MRTIVDLPEEHVRALDRLREREDVSRAELIRRAVEAYVQSHSVKALKDLPGFGAWKRKRVEGVKYQRRLRSEWDR